MTEIKCNKQIIHTYGELPQTGMPAPNFYLTDIEFKTISLEIDFANKPVLINVYPSLDSTVCFSSIEKFQALFQEEEINIIGVSMDTPFALKRIHKKISNINIHLLSDMRNRHFGSSYGVTIADGALAGFLARSVFLLDAEHRVIYSELVADIKDPPNYQAVMDIFKK